MVSSITSKRFYVVLHLILRDFSLSVGLWADLKTFLRRFFVFKAFYSSLFLVILFFGDSAGFRQISASIFGIQISAVTSLSMHSLISSLFPSSCQ